MKRLLIGCLLYLILDQFSMAQVPFAADGDSDRFSPGDNYELLKPTAEAEWPAHRPFAGLVFYVRANAAMGGNGASWATAFNSVTAALTAAGAADTIKVARGVYKAQHILKNGVVLLGGYPDTGNPTDANRNWGTQPTILSGEAGNPTNPFDNLSNVVSGFNLSATTILDGFIIEAGYGSGTSQGVALNLINSSLQVNNCVFRKNIASNNLINASSLLCTGGNPRFSRCFFEGNEDRYYGTVRLRQNANAELANCVFYANKGGNVASINQSTAALRHCVFFNNQGGVPNVNDSIRFAPVWAENGASVTVANSIFFKNIYSASTNNGTMDSLDVAVRNATITVINSITQTYNTGNPSLLGVNPKFRDTARVAGPDGFYFTADDGLQLLNPCSPAMNRGDNAAAVGIATDMVGNPRLFGALPDLGAYEVQAPAGSIPTTLYVRMGATGANDGSSWANAFTSLQAALQSCSDTIRVAAGNYTASNANPESSFWLENKRVILGGYPATGNPDDSQRNPTLHPTILTATLPVGGGVKSWAIVRGRQLDSTAVLDGFVVSDANNINRHEAAIMFTFNAAPVVRNTVVRNNISGFYSAALITAGASRPVFYNCTFSLNGGFNISFANQGAVYNIGNAAPAFRRCTFSNNSTWVGNVSPYYGGAITNINASPIIDSCTFLKNIANNQGGAIANFNNSSPLITNSNFLGNKAATGCDIYNDASSPQVRNCLFADSVAAENGGSIANFNGSSPFFYNCRFRNGMAIYNGGMVYNHASSPTFDRCVFTGAKASSGGVFFNTNNSQPKIYNSVATGNQTTSSGSFMANGPGTATIVNTTLVNNLLASLSSSNQVISNGGNIVLQNSIVWANDSRPASGSTVLNDITPGSNVSISNSILRFTGPVGANGNLIGIDPRLLDITNPAGPDGQFFTADDGIALCSCSPAVNAGNNTVVAGYNNDFLNNARVANGTVDIGAVEFQPVQTTVVGTVYVNAAATGLGTGQSWQNAYPTMRQAVQNKCADTIKVAAGIYYPAVAARDSVFDVNRGLILLGGYPATGNPADSLRNPAIHRSILSGDIGLQGDSTDNSYNIMRIKCDDTTVVVDGITFARAAALTNLARMGGGITAFDNKNLLVKNCRFENNFSSGGSAINSAGKITVEGCIFENNNSQSGTIYVSGTLIPYTFTVPSNAVIRNSVFHNNQSLSGGAVYCLADARFENVLFHRNTANTAGGVFLENNPAASFINCNFVRNNASATFVGIGLRNSNSFIQSTPRPLIRNCIFFEQSFSGTPMTNGNSDWIWANGNSTVDPLNITHSATLSSGGFGNNNISPTQVVFRNPTNAIGPDGVWLTADDGLQLDRCSRSINRGDNSSVTNMPVDMMGNPRIRNTVVDMGTYEYQPTTPDYILTRASDSLVANLERNDTGWTHYFRGCELLMMVKTPFSYGYGFIGDGLFRAMVKTTPLYGSGSGTNLSSAAYVTPGVNWHVMNRIWQITTTAPIIDSILVRIPFTNSDFNDLKGSNHALQNPQGMVFYTVDTALNPLNPAAPTTVFKPYYNGPVPTTRQWRLFTKDTIHYAEFFVRKLIGGGAGSGTGVNGGPQTLESNGCDNVTRLLTAPAGGGSYQWQVNTGSGYANLADDANHSGSNTASLNIANPPSAWYGRTYRCLVNGVAPADFYTLLFRSVWTGAVSNAWENPLNWSCGKVPDDFTDVVINSGTIVINSNVTINSLQLNPGVSLTVGTGYTLTIRR
jgi:hypothetical protein